MLKRQIDIAISIIGLVLLSPLLVVIALLVRYKLGKPVIFRQYRPGLYGKPFEIVKFRSMRDVYDKQGRKLSEKERLTPFGQRLRATSLDELPELWNVLKGDMSLVGPRPLLMEYLPYYSAHQARRHEVRPGVTGWAQVNGRNGISWESKFDYDIWYVDNQTFLLDVKILLLTVKKVFLREGISYSSDVAMPNFKQSKLHNDNGGQNG
ncbi:sugar transferase [Halomonas venusta]|uniref:sugar transferase n=1 Tax=Vreelandella venusta TaxID=44935 RepID=UPI00295F014D|nr:sugar transferase [Halomonas venusta]MDW0358020.1 sugar transferase [Halomonas venusta]